MTELSRDSYLAHGGIAPDSATGAVVPPIHMATTYVRDAAGLVYARDDNPSFVPVEQLLARLEGGADARVFASGMAAATAVFSSLRPGDHLVMAETLYWGTTKFIDDFARPAGLDVTTVDATDIAAVAAAVRPGSTRLVWIETPANPTWEIVDIAATADIAHDAGALLAVDSTTATPIVTRPIEYGADLVMHSATKALNGHSDVLAGAVVTAADVDLWPRICSWRIQAGAVLGPVEAWLLLRGMRTLSLRVQRAGDTATWLAEQLAGRDDIVEVLHPSRPDHAGHEVARRQMEGFGTMLSIRVAGGFDRAAAVARSTDLWLQATSLGGVESLIEHRRPVEGPTSTTPDDLLRLSVGIEAPEDLLGDLVAALDAP